jgi:antitoxin (DNA-binding transcriptional repressor) of toxin-antitoxin stability system
MSTHSIAELQDRLPELIDRALVGERVVITRDGRLSSN